MRLELAPAIQDGDGLSDQFLREHMRAEYMVRSKAETDFEAYCRSWWREYSALRPDHVERRVQLFARSELGIHRCVCTFVRPLREYRGVSLARPCYTGTPACKIVRYAEDLCGASDREGVAGVFGVHWSRR